MINLILQGKGGKGEAVGRKIGFPTANLTLTNPPKIKRGVYATLITLKQQTYLGLAYFGPRYIFKKKNDSFEVFIFNFNKNIYRQTLKVKLVKFLRAPKHVNNLKELKQLLEQDLHRLDQDVILVNRQDKIIGIVDKIAAHQGQAKLHRAISVQLFNHKNELLIQQRSKSKRLFPGFWANTVCTDVRPYESCSAAAERRLQEEFGLKAKLKPIFKFTYASSWQRGGENEIDQVFTGRVNLAPKPDPAEIKKWQFINLALLKKQVKPLAPWFKLILKKLAASDIFN